MSQICRLFAQAIVVLLVGLTASFASAADAPHVIKEGVGWERFTVGASANSLIDALGFPDNHSRGRMLRWDKAGLNCLLNDKGEVIEVRFEKRFKGTTENGVKFGMSADQVRKIYGDAATMDFRGVGTKLIWPSRGILIWFHNNNVYQMVVFKPQV